MDGTTASLIAIPITAILALAAWLILVAYAATHPQWKHRTQAARPGNTAPVDGRIGPAEPRAGLAPTDTGQDASPEQPAKLAA
jgi:hypothetical protein